MTFDESIVDVYAPTNSATVYTIHNPIAVNPYYPSNSCSVYTRDVLPYYGTLVGAENYFNTRLHSHNWEYADRKDRESSLYMATRIIETLHFKGKKADPLQPLFFPRTVDVGYQPCPSPPVSFDRTLTDFSRGGLDQLGYPPVFPDQPPTGTPTVPGDIEVACYEIALCLLNGIDPDIESRNLSVTSQGYAGARTSYDRSFIQDHMRAGVPSALAWSILRPYLADPKALKVVRGP